MKDNILPASVPVTLDGEAYVLRYRAYAFIFYAEHCGGDLLADLRDVAERMKNNEDGAGMTGAFAKLRDLLWCGLVDAQPAITRDQAARLFGLGDLPALLPIMTRALRMGMPETAEPAVAGRPILPEPLRLDSVSSNGGDSGQVSEAIAVSAV
jgi:hypothetical protein